VTQISGRKFLVVSIALVLTFPLFATTPAIAETYKAADFAGVLTLAKESNSGTYNRNLFKHWIDQDGDGCDTRSEVLIEESSTAALLGPKCKVISGKWLSRFDNRSFTNPSQLDIDHLVPLKEAWESGASQWNSAQRQAFANDLDFAGSLIAVSASSNRSKGDKDPAQWQPTHKAFRCTYAVTWIQVKYRWSLTADQAEITSLKKMLNGCSKTNTYQLPDKAAEIDLPSNSPSPEPSKSETPKPTQEPSPTPTPTQEPSPTPSENLPTVSPGAYCSKDKEGTKGRGSNGNVYTCKTSPTDSRLRWRL